MTTNKGKIYLIPSLLATGTAAQVLSPHIKEIVSQTSYFFAENIRTARRFISDLGIGVTIENLTFYELNKDTPRHETIQQLQKVIEGQNMGIISEAGCPGIADPGAVAVQLAHQYQIQVVPLVGPSSILLALMASGFSGQSFAFHGYLPIDKHDRAKTIKNLERDAIQKDQTQIFMETPFRNNQLLEEILHTCQPQTPLCIATQITAPDEMIYTQPVKEWRKQKPDLHKKPTIFLLYK